MGPASSAHRTLPENVPGLGPSILRGAERIGRTLDRHEGPDAVVLQVVERVLGLRPIGTAREEEIQELLEGSSETAVEEHVAGRLLPLVDQDHDCSDEKGLVGLCNSA